MEIFRQIESILNYCRNECTKRAELARQYGHVHSKIDGYCTWTCPKGGELQSIGKRLDTKRKVKTPDWWDPGQDIMADTPIISGEAG